jgi:hypothetical protein
MTNERKINYPEILDQRRYRPDLKPPQEDVIFKIGEHTIGTAGNYCVFAGAPKAGKSSYLSATIASAFLPHFQDNFGIKLTPPPGRPRVALFDTESSLFDFHRHMERIRIFANKESHPPTLDAFNTRQDGPYMIKGQIWNYLENHPDCAILVVDGFLDLCLNYNDEVETRELVNFFKLITQKFNILLIGVLHISKGNFETLGHLGSNTDRWAQSTLLVEKNKENRQFILRSKFLRSSDDFEPIAIMKWEDRFTQVPYVPTIQQTFKSKK